MEGDIGYNERQRFVSSEKDPLCVSSVTKFVVKRTEGRCLAESYLSRRRFRFVDHGFITFVSYESLSTDGGKFYLLAREKSYLLSIVLRSTSRLE